MLPWEGHLRKLVPIPTGVCKFPTLAHITDPMIHLISAELHLTYRLSGSDNFELLAIA
jgi:hypothetical protein